VCSLALEVHAFAEVFAGRFDAVVREGVRIRYRSARSFR
jgi:hypothetical protein